MQKFQAGHNYYINGGGEIYVIKRTEKYITVSGKTKHDAILYKRFYVYDDNAFNLGEYILIDSGIKRANLKYFCFAGHETEQSIKDNTIKL